MKDEFYLKDELQYTMRGKTLKCILNQLQKESKVPFADISQGQSLPIDSVVGQSESFICDHCDEGFTDMSKEVSIDIKCYEKLVANK